MIPASGHSQRSDRVMPRPRPTAGGLRDALGELFPSAPEAPARARGAHVLSAVVQVAAVGIASVAMLLRIPGRPAWLTRLRRRLLRVPRRGYPTSLVLARVRRVRAGSAALYRAGRERIRRHYHVPGVGARPRGRCGVLRPVHIPRERRPHRVGETARPPRRGPGAASRRADGTHRQRGRDGLVPAACPVLGDAVAAADTARDGGGGGGRAPHDGFQYPGRAARTAACRATVRAAPSTGARGERGLASPAAWCRRLSLFRVR